MKNLLLLYVLMVLALVSAREGEWSGAIPAANA
jgi:hypothetical protein